MGEHSLLGGDWGRSPPEERDGYEDVGKIVSWSGAGMIACVGCGGSGSLLTFLLLLITFW